MLLRFLSALLFETLSSNGNSAWTLTEVTIFVGQDLSAENGCVRTGPDLPE